VQVEQVRNFAYACRSFLTRCSHTHALALWTTCCVGCPQRVSLSCINSDMLHRPFALCVCVCVCVCVFACGASDVDRMSPPRSASSAALQSTPFLPLILMLYSFRPRNKSLTAATLSLPCSLSLLDSAINSVAATSVMPTHFSTNMDQQPVRPLPRLFSPSCTPDMCRLWTPL
jgi:hypothetical protein